jgi:tetratricopeptide (TPR) repeat protein
MDLENVLAFYKRLFMRYRSLALLTSFVYIVFAGFYLAKATRLTEWFRAPSEVKELQKRVLDLEAQRQQQDQVIATLTARATQTDFLKPLKFQERWRDDRARETLSRLVEYAEFAISKNDFEHAERFYNEANDVQPTVTIPYYQGRLAYRRGDLQRAEVMWLEAIKRDPDRKYPDLRLYLGVLYYQMGRFSEAKRYLSSFGGDGGGGDGPIS